MLKQTSRLECRIVNELRYVRKIAQLSVNDMLTLPLANLADNLDLQRNLSLHKLTVFCDFVSIARCGRVCNFDWLCVPRIRNKSRLLLQKTIGLREIERQTEVRV